ncbi:MAG: type 4a pilus biogenesis protein PilO [Elusimicrobia bacterium]|nr:type 4a pilus biogenesis protein PilO [Elusimicrobiota bacterium]
MAAKIKLTPKQTQVLVGSVVLVGALGFVYFKYFWQPISERIATAKAGIEEVEGKIGKAKAMAARLPQIQREIVVLNEQAADAEKRLPKTKDVPAVIDTVAGLARKHRVDLANFTPGAQAAKQYFIEVPYQITASGSFHDIGRFFSAMALEERIFSVRNVTVGGLGSREGTINVTFALIAYQYKG